MDLWYILIAINTIAIIFIMYYLLVNQKFQLKMFRRLNAFTDKELEKIMTNPLLRR